MIKDSGQRREFNSGAKRDMAEGKGDMVSLPNNATLRLSKHYENGAKKYGRWNYTKGIPLSSFLDSALRHIFKYLDGWDDEDHLSAAAFNILGAMEMEAKHKELIDIPSREGKNCFEYAKEETKTGGQSLTAEDRKEITDHIQKNLMELANKCLNKPNSFCEMVNEMKGENNEGN